MQIADTPYYLAKWQTGFELLEDTTSNRMYFVGYFDTPQQLYQYLQGAMDETAGCKSTPPYSPEIYSPVCRFRKAFKAFISKKPFKDIKDLN
jgi:hypothetical protein